MSDAISDGCSACACGVEGACDILYFPSYALPGAILLALGLLVLVILIHRRVLKANLKIILIAWTVAALLFAGLVWIQTETEGERTARDAERCRTAPPTNIACEY